MTVGKLELDHLDDNVTAPLTTRNERTHRTRLRSVFTKTVFTSSPEPWAAGKHGFGEITPSRNHVAQRLAQKPPDLKAPRWHGRPASQEEYQLFNNLPGMFRVEQPRCASFPTIRASSRQGYCDSRVQIVEYVKKRAGSVFVPTRLDAMVPPIGFEPTTPALGERCSIL